MMNEALSHFGYYKNWLQLVHFACPYDFVFVQ